MATAMTRGMPFWRDDGGRAKAGHIGKAGDCACRSVAIATGKPYAEVYNDINTLAETERHGRRKRGTSSARNGVYSQLVRRLMDKYGWTWYPTMRIGSGTMVHLRPGELPSGRLVVNVSKHYTAVIDGMVHDTHDPCREGTRCVYGYWAAD